jgi:hypothetical protein
LVNHFEIFIGIVVLAGRYPQQIVKWKNACTFQVVVFENTTPLVISALNVEQRRNWDLREHTSDANGVHGFANYHAFAGAPSYLRGIVAVGMTTFRNNVRREVR